MELKQARRQDSAVRYLVIASCFLFGCTMMNPPFAYPEDNQYDKSLSEQFLKEAPERWEEYVEKTKLLQGHISATRVQSDGYVSKSSLTLKKGTEGQLSLTTTIETMPSKDKAKETTSYTEGLNPLYAFALKRNHASRPWALTVLTERQDGPPSFLARLNRAVDYHANRLVYIENERLADMVRQAEFRFIGCRRVQASSDNLVLVDFDYPHDDVRRNEVQRGTLVLDPLRYWCLRSYNVWVKVPTGGQGTVKLTVVKWRDTDGFPVPIATTIETDAIEDNIQYKNKREHNYDLSIPDSLPPDSEFTLSTYNLPEPKLSGRRIPLYVWVAIVGVCCLCVGMLFRWRARRADKGCL